MAAAITSSNALPRDAEKEYDITLTQKMPNRLVTCESMQNDAGEMMPLGLPMKLAVVMLLVNQSFSPCFVMELLQHHLSAKKERLLTCIDNIPRRRLGKLSNHR